MTPRSSSGGLRIAPAVALAIVACLLPVASGVSEGWGLTGHKMVTDRAVRLLPTNIQDFYWANRAVLMELSIAADMRKDGDRSEGPRHYIDLEHYSSVHPPKLAADALSKLGMNELSKGGWLPWNAQMVYAGLVDAMRRQDIADILRLSGDLSHYVADAHIPLHTTENYDGKSTGDTGVHARFESRLVEQFPESLVFEPRPASLIVDVPARLWAIVLSSSTSVSDVLKGDRQNAYENRDMDGYSVVQARATHGPLAARRMNDSAFEVASFWYTAWVEAGRPKLPAIDFSTTVTTAIFPSGEALFLRGHYTRELSMQWPLAVRHALRRIEDFLRLETPLGLARIEWSSSNGEIRIGVTGYDGATKIDAREIQKSLRRLAPGARIRFWMEE